MKRNILLTALLFTFISCSNLVQRNESASQQNQKSPDGKTYIVISSTSLSRAAENVINADTNFGPDQGDPSKLTDLVLTGKKTSAEGEAETLLTAETYAELINQQIMIEPGEWTFTLAGKLNNYLFSGTEAREIIQGEINTLSFTLKSDEQYGSLELTIEWSNTAAKVVGYLYDPDDISKMIASKTASEAAFEEFEEPDETGATLTKHRTTLTFDKTSAGNKLPSGTYYLKVNFDGPENTLNLGSATYYVTIANGLITKKTITTDLSPTYKLEWNRDGGEFTLGQLIAAGYSRKSIVTLPEISKPGYFFDGWFDNEEFNGNALTLFSCSQHSGDITLYAKWRAPEFYVSGTGDDTTGEGTEDKPFETIERACEAIIATDAKYNPQYMDWTIYIMGDVTGKHDSDKKAGERRTGTQVASDYGRSVIPSELTLANAKSILLTGYHELDTDGNPQDLINRGITGNTSYTSATGNALAIATEVPVTIKNVMLTRGDNSSTNGGDDPYYIRGGGLSVAEGATVTLDDGVLITKNKASYGGGVYNAGTLYIVGTAAIGDKNATTVAVRPVTSDTCSNEATKAGGGLYNVGTLYLGTDEKALEGGIYYNCGLTIWGGGIYNANNGTIIMNSGNIAYNDGQETCGGVELNSGSFTMNGGSIHHNSTGGQGGGVYINSGATFNFTGGTISANWATKNGGGVYIYGDAYSAGIMYMYGTAVIGDKSKTSAPTSRTGANATDGNGAGICIINGKFYMGYSSYTSETDNVTADLDGGIYYNYIADSNSDSKGGGIYATSGGSGQPNTSSSANACVRLHSGTIANNYCKNGGAICTPSGAKPLVIGGDVKIPSGTNHENDVFIYSSFNRLFIEDSLKEITSDDPIYIKLTSSEGVSYYSGSGLMLAQNATISSLSEVLDKFAVQPLMNKNNGIVTHWLLDSSTGNVVQNSSTFYVASLAKNGSDSNTGLASNSPLASITKAIEKINELNDENKDYIIEVNGEILGPQIIADPSETVKIKANSIYIKGKNSNSASLDDIINANLGESEAGSALTIDTKVPVTLYYIGITGGHGNLIDSGTKVAGGGLYIGDNTTVSLEGKVHIYNNTNYYGYTDISGFGGGIYVGENTKLYIPSSAVDVRENKSTHYGAGIYVANGAYVTMPAAAKIRDNSFDERFTQDGQAISTYGGGVYIADNATFEMTNGTISGNTANTTGSSSGLGNGIFVSGTAGAEAHFKLGALGMVGLTNDVYLQNNVPIELISTLTSTSANAARITPGTYPTEDKTLELLTFASDSITKSYAAGKLEITPQTLPNGEKQYWYINSDCKLEKRTEIGITVSVPAGQQNDIQVEVKLGETVVENNKQLRTSSSSLEFTVKDDSNYEEVVWMVDGDEDSKEWSSSFEFDPSGKAKGVYVVYLEAKDYDGNYYSYTAQVTIE